MTTVRTENAPYRVALGVFDGSLDLLLHLIREQKINIYDIPIAKITEQYLAYLHLMEQLDLEIASEWLVMAATLLEIKSRMLLPQDVAGEEDEEDGVDPRLELVERLVDYEKFKLAAEHFREREELRAKLFVRGDVDFELKPVLSLEDITAADLLTALQKVLAGVGDENVTTVRRRKITVRMRMREIWQRLMQCSGRLTFEELFEGDITKAEVVITFLALLELIIARRVKVYQQYTFGPITITAVEGNHETERG